MLLHGFGLSLTRPERGSFFFNHAIILKKRFICAGIYANKIFLTDAIGWRIEEVAGGWRTHRPATGIPPAQIAAKPDGFVRVAL